MLLRLLRWPRLLRCRDARLSGRLFSPGSLCTSHASFILDETSFKTRWIELVFCAWQRYRDNSESEEMDDK